jgi:hypothetical protein
LFQPVQARSGIGKGGELGEDFALEREGGGGVSSLADVDADHGSTFGQDGLTGTVFVHDRDSC